MIEDNTNNETKEFYIKKVEKYNEDLNSLNRNISEATTMLGIGALYVFLNIIGITPEDFIVRLFLHISIGTGVFLSIKFLIIAISKKTGIKIRIEEIEEFFKHHGLTLQDEISKSKGR